VNLDVIQDGRLAIHSAENYSVVGPAFSGIGRTRVRPLEWNSPGG